MIYFIIIYLIIYSKEYLAMFLISNLHSIHYLIFSIIIIYFIYFLSPIPINFIFSILFLYSNLTYFIPIVLLFHHL